MNEYGLDVRYFKEKLNQIVRDADRYTPSEMERALMTYADVAKRQKSCKDPEHKYEQGKALECKNCGHKVKPGELVETDAEITKWECPNCKTGQYIKE